jgi:hypothetical protein
MQVRDSAVNRLNRRWSFAQELATFASTSEDAIIGELVMASQFDVTAEQTHAWAQQIDLLKVALSGQDTGKLYLEFHVPRLGRRIDAVLVIEHVLFVIEFKVGESRFTGSAYEQVWDYALDLRNFHDTSHHVAIAPVLVATAAPCQLIEVSFAPTDPLMPSPLRAGGDQLRDVITFVLASLEGSKLDPEAWESGGYSPTPTIIEAARALYSSHSVESISRNDAGAINLTRTAKAVETIIDQARSERRKILCLVTGVPGAGKTLVGLNAATRHRDVRDNEHSVFLSGNGPLVKVLREVLARDAVQRSATAPTRLTKAAARQQVKAFIQNVHHFRDEYLRDPRPPADHVALFDEAQRAWDLEKTRQFMKQKKGLADFLQSEPEFLISCLDRHSDWAVVVGLIGGGQEINTGEAGVSEWVESILRSFPTWQVHISPRLREPDQLSPDLIEMVGPIAKWNADLHLATSMRSFRAERLSDFVHQVLRLEAENARAAYAQLADRYPIYLTRSLDQAKEWIRGRARGSERYGLVASSRAERLKPNAINVRTPVDPVHWFLNDRNDTRSSYYLEDPGTEFLVQGLELDWACVVWDGDLRYSPAGWSHNEFRGSKWNRIKKDQRKRYLENAYRVLLTRARQGMVIVVPEGSNEDPTRKPSYYDVTHKYLLSLGLRTLDSV